MYSTLIDLGLVYNSAALRHRSAVSYFSYFTLKRRFRLGSTVCSNVASYRTRLAAQQLLLGVCVYNSPSFRAVARRPARRMAGPAEKKRKEGKCRKCLFHGVAVARAGHSYCPHKTCDCAGCRSLDKISQVMSSMVRCAACMLDCSCIFIVCCNVLCTPMYCMLQLSPSLLF